MSNIATNSVKSKKGSSKEPSIPRLGREKFLQTLEKKKGWLIELYVASVFRRCLKKYPEDATFVATHAHGYTKARMLEDAFKLGHVGVVKQVLEAENPSNDPFYVASQLFTSCFTKAPDWLWGMARAQFQDTNDNTKRDTHHRARSVFSTMLRKTGGRGPLAEKFLNFDFPLRGSKALGLALGTPIFDRLIDKPWDQDDVADAWARLLHHKDQQVVKDALPSLVKLSQRLAVPNQKHQELMLGAWRFQQPLIAQALEPFLGTTHSNWEQEVFQAKMVGQRLEAFAEHPTRKIDESVLIPLIKRMMSEGTSKEFVDALYNRHKSLGPDPWVRVWGVSLGSTYDKVKVRVVGVAILDMTPSQHGQLLGDAIERGDMASVRLLSRHVDVEKFRELLTVAPDNETKFETQKILAARENKDIKQHVGFSKKKYAQPKRKM